MMDLFDENGCIIWPGAKTTDGYGRVYVSRGQYVSAHRLAYETHVGPIPEGLTLDHLCRNRACVNPDHLEPVTRRENTLRGEGPAAHHARQTHCVHGHEFTPSNTRTLRGGRVRVCVACHRRRNAAYARKQRCR